MPAVKIETSDFDPSIVYARSAGSGRVVAYRDCGTGEVALVWFLRKQLGHEQRVRLIKAFTNGELGRFHFKVVDLTAFPDQPNQTDTLTPSPCESKL